MLSIRLAGADVALHPSGGAFLPWCGTVLVADAQFGKAVSFRRLGVPVPQGTTSETLGQLTALVRDTRAQRIVFLGDFLHSARSHAAATLDAMPAQPADSLEALLEADARARATAADTGAAARLAWTASGGDDCRYMA